MGMRLLPKSEIDRAKAAEKKQEIDEGLKVARKIDNLREVAAETETNLETFRSETIAKIHDEITIEVEKRDDLKKEVSVLEEKRENALKPLDAKWEEVKKAEEAVELRKTSIVERENNVTEREKKVSDDRKEADSFMLRVEAKDAISNARLLDAETAATKSEAALDNARVVEKKALALKSEVEEALTHREELVLTRENDATMKEKDISTREKELADGWKLLRDRQALFERNLKRQ